MAEVIGVRFKNIGKVYYFDPDGVVLKKGDMVIVETARGVECGDDDGDINDDHDDDEYDGEHRDHYARYAHALAFAVHLFGAVQPHATEDEPEDGDEERADESRDGVAVALALPWRLILLRLVWLISLLLLEALLPLGAFSPGLRLLLPRLTRLLGRLFCPDGGRDSRLRTAIRAGHGIVVKFLTAVAAKHVDFLPCRTRFSYITPGNPFRSHLIL